MSQETIKKIDEQISQLQARKKAIEQKEKSKAKKEHTQRLIKLGEVAERYNFRTPEQLEEVLKVEKSANQLPSLD